MTRIAELELGGCAGGEFDSYNAARVAELDVSDSERRDREGGNAAHFDTDFTEL